MNRIATFLALAATMLLSACAAPGGPATPATTPTPDAPATPPASTPVDCTTLPKQADSPETLATGIARISLCNEPGQDALFNRWAPVDALVQGADAVAEAYNAAEPRTENMPCPADMGSAYRMVVEYPDGRVVQLRGELYGCRVVGGRVAAREVLAAFSDALGAQRASAAPADGADRVQGDTVCGILPTSSWVAADPARTVKGLFCSGGRFDQARGIVSGEDWETVRTDLAANARAVTPEAPAPACNETVSRSLVAVSTPGDVLVMNEQCGWYSWYAADGQKMVWEPGEAAHTILRRI